ncbi:MAG: PIN domain-containing protein [Streptosporangiales bacterium]|nr:PIN domain-containing protein [Streptosporangiales bacterium]
MLYLDSSALAKLFAPEAESEALRAWLAADRGRWITSTLTEVELTRAVARAKPTALAHVPGVLARCDRLDIDDRVRADAAVLVPPELRTLDSIHLATALELASELEALVTYDKRLAQAAQAAGLTVETPS